MGIRLSLPNANYKNKKGIISMTMYIKNDFINKQDAIEKSEFTKQDLIWTAEDETLAYNNLSKLLDDLEYAINSFRHDFDKGDNTKRMWDYYNDIEGFLSDTAKKVFDEWYEKHNAVAVALNSFEGEQQDKVNRIMYNAMCDYSNTL